MSEYRLDEESYDAIAQAGSDVVTVLATLHGGAPRIRRHIGSGGLHLYAAAPNGRWLAMAFIETVEDDVWLLTKVRVLTEEETVDIRRALEEGGKR